MVDPDPTAMSLACDAGQVIALLKRDGHHALHEMEARADGFLGEKIGTLVSNEER